MASARSAILTYHSLDRSGSVLSTYPEQFGSQMEYLAASGIPVVPLAKVQKLPGSVALTFDDGFRNLRQHALPVLERYRLPATVFVVSRHCGGLNDWSSQPVRGIPRLELMNWTELSELAQAGSEIGAHTLHHPDLSALSEDRIDEEIRNCRAEIEDRTGAAVISLAYPYGSSTPAVRRIAQQYFELACGTSLRFVTPASDPYDLPRIDTYYLQTQLRFRNLLTNGGAAYLTLRRLLRRFRR